MVGLCLVAVFAIAAVTASSASALPEWGKCTAKAGGKYSDGNCTVKAKKGTGTFEWTKGKSLAPVPFTGKNVGSGGVLTTTLRACGVPGATPHLKQFPRKKCIEEGGEEQTSETEPIRIECESETSSGEANGTKNVGNIKVTFNGCTLGGFLPCKGQGLAEGEIKTTTLKGALGYINKAKKEVGVVLEPAVKHGIFANFECGGLNETTVGVGNKKDGAFYEDKPGVENHGGYDQVISPITPVNTMTSEYTQVYAVSSEAPFANIPTKFEGKHISALEDTLVPLIEPGSKFQWASAGEEITNVNTPAEAGEIKA